MATITFAQCSTLNADLWKSLPDDLLLHLCEFWCDKKETIYRHILKLENFENMVVKFQNPTTYALKLENLPNCLKDKDIPFVSIWQPIPIITRTKKCVWLRWGNSSSKQRFNLTKDKEKWEQYCQTVLFWQWKRIVECFAFIWRKKYPAINKIIQRYKFKTDNDSCCGGLYKLKYNDEIKKRVRLFKERVM